MGNFLQSIIDRDPAAKSKLSLILTYPGVKAVFFHRIANFFCIAKFNLIARLAGIKEIYQYRDLLFLCFTSSH
mgnify:CR=1 FL=1